MEARARAAVARLQEMTEEPKSATPSAPATVPEVSVDEAETISRTLLLAQRTADSTVAEARGEAAPDRAGSQHRSVDHARFGSRDVGAAARRSTYRGAAGGRSRADHGGQRGRSAQGASRLPRVRCRATRDVPRRTALAVARSSHLVGRHRRTGTRRARRSPSSAVVGVRRRRQRGGDHDEPPESTASATPSRPSSGTWCIVADSAELTASTPSQSPPRLGRLRGATADVTDLPTPRPCGVR